MTKIAGIYKIDGDHAAEMIHEVGAALANADGELQLDLSNLFRLDTSGLRAIEELAAKAEEKSVKVLLHGVNVGVYKVLKLSRLTSRFAFVN